MTTLETVAALAAALSDSDRATLLALLTPPVNQPPADPRSDAVGIPIMRLCECQKKAEQSAMPSTVHHLPLSKECAEALDIIRWLLAVPKITPDSPRMVQYVSQWDVPGKIARAKADGSFEATVSTAGPINPAWLRLIPAALAEHQAFMTATRQVRTLPEPEPRKQLCISAAR